VPIVLLTTGLLALHVADCAYAPVVVEVPTASKRDEELWSAALSAEQRFGDLAVTPAQRL